MSDNTSSISSVGIGEKIPFTGFDVNHSHLYVMANMCNNEDILLKLTKSNGKYSDLEVFNAFQSIEGAYISEFRTLIRPETGSVGITAMNTCFLLGQSIDKKITERQFLVVIFLVYSNPSSDMYYVLGLRELNKPISDIYIIDHTQRNIKVFGSTAAIFSSYRVQGIKHMLDKKSNNYYVLSYDSVKHLIGKNTK